MASARHHWLLIGPEQQAQIEAENHYQQAQHFLAAHDWAPAEGLLWWMHERAGWAGAVVVDQPLGYALVMQGQNRLALDVLQPLLQHPQRNFWVAHLAADALRGSNDLQDAVPLYRQSLADGSDSPITARNLLQVLWQLDAEAALAQLQLWHACDGGLQGVVLEGVQQALASGQAPLLDEWLAAQGLATDAQLQRLAVAALERLDAEAARRWLTAQADRPWAEEILGRLQRWQVPGFSSGVVD